MGNASYLETPLWDNSLPLKKRLDYLVENLTLEEKFEFLGTGCPTIERLGIQSTFHGGEAAHGIEARHDQSFNKGEPEPTTIFPQPIGMSSTWDTTLLTKIGVTVGNEARVLYQRHKNGGLCRWAPTIDMERDPRWGRTEEAYGEDPYLTGKMASAYIQGMRGVDPFYIRCGATLKHFYANNTEKDRIFSSSSIDPRNKHEYYLEPFKRAITEGKAEAIMTAYNEINGVPCIVNNEVKNIVKEQWGLRGHVVCDGGDMMQTVSDHKYFGSHAETIAYGLKAGIDCFTDNREVVKQAAKEAYQAGLITEADLDTSICNSFSTRIRLGYFDAIGQNPYAHITEKYINSEENKSLTLEAATKAMVLLKNEGQILPLTKENSSFCVIGPLSDVWYKDWYSGIPPYSVTPLQGIKEYNKGTRKNLTNSKVVDGLPRVRIRYQEKYLCVTEEGFVTLGSKELAETFTITDWGNGNLTIATSQGKYLSADEEEGLITATKTEVFEWFVKEAFDFHLVGNLGEKSFQTIFEILSEQKRQEISVTIDTWKDDYVAINKEGKLSFSKEEKVTLDLELVSDGIEEAKEYTKNSDYAILVMGCNPVINSKEEIDRNDLDLPPYQERLIKQVHKVNPKVILVLITNYPYAIRWEKEHIPAIITTTSGSQELGNAIAAVLFGDVSPSGRLPMTWYLDTKDLPPIEDYDIIRGNRTYQYFNKEVLYPFGHGLTYTTMQYQKLTVQLEDFTNLLIKVTIANTGNRISDEVVQVYVRQEVSRTVRPRLQLKAFERVKNILPGEKREIEFIISTSDLTYYDVVNGGMILEESEYTILVGASSEDIRLRETAFIPGVKVGSRNLRKKILADHYDDCRNSYLHRGSLGDTAVVVKNKTEAAILLYRDVRIEEKPIKFHSTVQCVGEGSLIVSYIKQSDVASSEVKLGDITLENQDKFCDVIIPINWDRITCNEVITLKITLLEEMKLSSFYAE
ncbi:glycoside hydrolase family 3 C-terminal domain-containing protein [Lachnoclostridium phytofermentans]|uniref:Glycoside hydrolase family 3 domain protein n=1 Tax=Lachnoclostridium phytofermentans (strain ATCC 700394 / DSM 18823 / ISDg) TaxID=357809 RepID=A9KSN0_LACP7|nr:glycoside hydrolase family 3 C-terminal domain-containing protein [Lachnoclostridium phytofermentans]ABX43682.1 glycoside hydrolase family 3 domain protein [Lachnoclostridium phytofermentans ISDg]